MRDFAKPIDNLDLVDAVNTRTQTAMYAEDLIINDTGKAEIVKHVRKVVPDGRIAIFAAAFGIEAVRLGDPSTLVIASYKMNSLGVTEFETDQQRYRLDTKQAAVHIVTCWSVNNRSAGRIFQLAQLAGHQT